VGFEGINVDPIRKLITYNLQKVANNPIGHLGMAIKVLQKLLQDVGLETICLQSIPKCVESCEKNVLRFVLKRSLLRVAVLIKIFQEITNHLRILVYLNLIFVGFLETAA
jgi:hypothetical protein